MEGKAMLAAIAKEFRLLSRDLHGIAVLFIMPMLFMFIMSVALSQRDDFNQNTKIALVGESSNLLNSQLIAILGNQENMNVDFFDIADKDNAKAKLIEGNYDFLLINPNQNTGNLSNESPLALLTLAGIDQLRLMNLQTIIQKSYLQLRLKDIFSTPNNDSSIMDENSVELKRQQQLDNYLSGKIITEEFINVEGTKVVKPSSVQQSVPAWLIFGMFFIMIPLSNVMTCEKQTNTIIRLRLAKSSAFSLLIAKLLPYFLINQLQFIGMILLGIYILPLINITGFVLEGAYWNYALLSIAISLSALGYALLVSVLAKSAEHAVVLGGGGNIIMAALGGIMVPSYMMPETMQIICLISPMSWALKGFHNLLLDQYDFVQILPQWLSLIGFALIFLLLAGIIYYRQLNNKHL